MNWTEFLLGFLIGSTIFSWLAVYIWVTSLPSSATREILDLTCERVDNLWDYARSTNRTTEHLRKQDDNLLALIKLTRKELGLWIEPEGEETK